MSTTPESYGLSIEEFVGIADQITSVTITSHEPTDGLARIVFADEAGNQLDAMDDIPLAFAAVSAQVVMGGGGWTGGEVAVEGYELPSYRFTRQEAGTTPVPETFAA